MVGACIAEPLITPYEGQHLYLRSFNLVSFPEDTVAQH